jgi:hypothetical protein
MKKPRKEWESHRRKIFSLLSETTKSNYRSMFNTIITAMTSDASHEAWYRHRLQRAHRESLSKHIRTFQKGQNHFQTLCVYWKYLNDLVPDDFPLKNHVFSNTKKDITFTRVCRVWDCVISYTDKRKKPEYKKKRTTPTFEGIVVTTLLRLCDSGIHVQHHPRFSDGSLCFLPTDPDLASTAVGFDYFRKCLENHAILCDTKLSEKTYQQNLNIIKPSAQEEIYYIAMDCIKKLSHGVTLEDATIEYFARCDSFVIK